MGVPAKEKSKSRDAAAEESELNEDQRELLRKMERAFQQAERGETRPFDCLLQELRAEREAEEIANKNGS